MDNGRRRFLAAVGTTLFGAGCLGDKDRDYEYPERDEPATPLLEPQEERATETPEPTDTPEDTGTETPDDTGTDTPDGSDDGTPQPDEQTPEPVERHTLDDMRNSTGAAESSLNRGMPMYNREFSVPEPILRTHSGSVAATSTAGDEYRADVTTETSNLGDYGDIGAFLDGSAGAREELEYELGMALAYMISSTAGHLDDYFPENQPDDTPVITDATYCIYGNNGGEVGIDPTIDDLAQAVTIKENTDGTRATWDALYESIVQDDMYVSP